MHKQMITLQNRRSASILQTFARFGKLFFANNTARSCHQGRGGVSTLNSGPTALAGMLDSTTQNQRAGAMSERPEKTPNRFESLSNHWEESFGGLIAVG